MVLLDTTTAKQATPQGRSKAAMVNEAPKPTRFLKISGLAGTTRVTFKVTERDAVKLGEILRFDDVDSSLA